MQWPWRQHTMGSGTMPRKTETWSGTTGKCTACVVYTCKMYILYTTWKHPHTEKIHAQGTHRNTAEEVHIRIIGPVPTAAQGHSARVLLCCYEDTIWWLMSHDGLDFNPRAGLKVANEQRLWALHYEAWDTLQSCGLHRHETPSKTTSKCRCLSAEIESKDTNTESDAIMEKRGFFSFIPLDNSSM